MLKKRPIFSRLLPVLLSISLTLPTAALELEDAKQLLQEYYVDPIPEEVFQQTTLEGLLDALGDPYTVYLPPQAHNHFLTSVNGTSVVGIGVSIESLFQDGGYRIASVLKDSPAEEAGLKTGDRIVAVDNTPLTIDSNLQAMISGPEGTEVTISIRRAAGTTKTLTLTRRTVPIPIVQYQLVDKLGYINCPSFGETVAETVDEALLELDPEAQVWVFDLRNNLGGTASAAASSAALFIGSGTMAYFRYGDGSYSYSYAPSGYPDHSDKPVIVLLNQNSASASELFASEIRDYEVGISIGQRTHGKGIAQYMLDHTTHPDLFDEDALKITSSRFFSPHGGTNHIVGILPTLLVSPEHTWSIAELLAEPQPNTSHDYIKLELAGQTFYIDARKACSSTYRAAFTELLEALPPSAILHWGTGTVSWQVITPEKAARIYQLSDYTPRVFSDTAESDFQEEINTLAIYRLLQGQEDGTFHPSEEITRGEFCAMLAFALNFSGNPSVTLPSDVPADAPYADAISALLSRGFLSASSDPLFRPDDPMLMQESVVILSKVAAWLSIDGDLLSQEKLHIYDWPNYYDFAEWAQDPAWRLDELGVPVDLLAPTQEMTREVTAKMLYHLLDSVFLLWH